MSDWLTYSPTSGHGNGTITLTSTTLTELNDRMETILALNSSDNLSASSVVTQTFMTPTSLTVDYVAWSTDISMYGGYGEKKNITYTVYANYDNGSSRDITNEVEVDGISDFVPSTTATSRTDVGDYDFVFEYRGIESSPVSVEMYQEAYTPLPPSHPVDKSEYLTFEIVSGGTFMYKNGSDVSSPYTINYRINGGNWIEGEAISGVTLNVSVGDIIEFKGHQVSYNGSDGLFKGTSYYNIYGNINSLIDDFSSEEWSSNYYFVFESIFSNSNVIDAGGLYLPSPDEDRSAYYRLFKGCGKLLRTPIIKHILGGNITAIFSECTALIEAPELPAIDSLESTFSDCKSLMSPPEIPSSVYVLHSTFSGCTSLVTTPIIPNNCDCSSTFAGCSSLVRMSNEQLRLCNANHMFKDCASLRTINSSITLVPNPKTGNYYSDAFRGMFSGCTLLTTAPNLIIEYMPNLCCYEMFKDCTSLTTAPDLTVTKLKPYCYQSMFQNCTSLSYIKCLATDISAANCTNGWLNNVSSTGTFVKDPNMSSWTTGDSGIPTGWTVVDAT